MGHAHDSSMKVFSTIKTHELIVKCYIHKPACVFEELKVWIHKPDKTPFSNPEFNLHLKSYWLNLQFYETHSHYLFKYIQTALNMLKRIQTLWSWCLHWYMFGHEYCLIREINLSVSPPKPLQTHRARSVIQATIHRLRAKTYVLLSIIIYW